MTLFILKEDSLTDVSPKVGDILQGTNKHLYLGMLRGYHIMWCLDTHKKQLWDSMGLNNLKIIGKIKRPIEIECA